METDKIDFEAEIEKFSNLLRQGGWILEEEGCRENFETMAHIVEGLGKNAKYYEKDTI